MNVRTLVVMSGAIVALAAPTAAGAKGAPAKHGTKHVKVTKVTKLKKHGGNPVIYIHSPGPLVPAAPPTAGEVCGQENDVLGDFGFSPMDCSALDGQTTSADGGSAPSQLCVQENEVLSDYGFAPVACSILTGETSSAAR